MNQRGGTAPKVYVVQENNHADYSDAERYGEVIFITADEYKPMNSSIKNIRIVEDIRTSMGRFDPDKDFLILTGNPTVMGYAFHLAMDKVNYQGQGITDAGINILQWDKISNSYKPFTFRA